MPFENQRLTAGTRRILERAIESVPGSDPDLVNARDVVLAMIAEEGHAAVILEQHFITEFMAESLPASDAQAEAGPIRMTSWIESLASETIHAGRRNGAATEVGSGYLLLALLQSDPVTEAWFLERGLDSETVLSAITEETGETSDRLPVDIRICESPPAPAETGDVGRILDATANRAREGLRTIEDFARFSLNDSGLQRSLKQTRHDLHAALAMLEERSHWRMRDIAGDVGKTVTTSSEMRRASSHDVVIAACKRLQESLRSLEEYGKTISTTFAKAIEVIRYNSYQIEKRLRNSFSSNSRLRSASLYLLVTSSACRTGLESVVRGAIAGGIDVIQLREKHRSEREIVEIGKNIRQWTADAGVLFIMNDRIDLAMLTNADGVHLGQHELSVSHARQLMGPNALVGISTHSADDVESAISDGADYIGMGPVFPSSTKSFDEFAGLEFVSEASRMTSHPAFAIGGIDGGNLRSVLEAGASRVAVSAAICDAESPAVLTGHLKGIIAEHQSATAR